MSNSPIARFTRIFKSALSCLGARRSSGAPLRSRFSLGVELLEDRTTPSTITTLPYVITSPGTYDVASDLYYGATYGNAVTVRAEGVVIDLHGHKIWSSTGASTSAVGIFADQQSYITIKNGTIQGFQFGIELLGQSRYGNQVQNMVLAQNWYFGLWVDGASTVISNNQINNTGGCNIPGYDTPIAMHVAGANVSIVNNAVNGMVSYPGVTHELVCLALDAAPNATVSGNTFSLTKVTSNSYGMWVNSTGNNYSSNVQVQNNSFTNLQYGSVFAYAYGHMKDNHYVNVTTKWAFSIPTTNVDLGGNVSTWTVTPPPPPTPAAAPVVVTPPLTLRTSMPTTVTVSAATTTTALRIGASQPTSAPSGLKVVTTNRTVQVQTFARKI